MPALDFMAPNLGWQRPTRAEMVARPPALQPGASARLPRLPHLLAGNAVEARKDLYCLSVVGPMAILCLDGYLSYEAGFSWPGSMTADRELLAAIEHCRENDGISGVLVDAHSPGGSAGGTSDVMRQMRLLASEKPTRAIAHDIAASKAYMIAGLCARFAATPSAMVGSVGSTFGVLYDSSQNLKDDGIVAFDTAVGKAKNLGAYGLPVDPDEVEAMRDTGMQLLSPILAMLSAPRRMSPEKFLALEARMFAGAEAVASGLVDEISDFETYASDFLSELQAGGPKLIVPLGGQSHDSHDPTQDDPEDDDESPPTPLAPGARMSKNEPEKNPATPAPTPTPTPEARPLTLEALKTASPELVAQLEAEFAAKHKAPETPAPGQTAPTPASFEDLHAAFGADDPAFVTTAMAAKMTLVVAHAEYAKKLKAQLAAVQPARKGPVLSATPPLAPTAPTPSSANGSPQPASFDAAVQLVRDEKKCSFAQAWHEAGRRYPELRAAHATSHTEKWSAKFEPGAKN